MPRYFFHVKGSVTEIDRDGTVLTDIRSARQEALRFIESLLAETTLRVDLGPLWVLEVTDDVGRVVISLEIAIPDPS